MDTKLQSSLLAALLSATLALTFAAVSGDARGARNLAQNAISDFTQNATGACKSALSTFNGQLRKRPLAIQNQGTAPVFISCSLVGTDRARGGIFEIRVFADNYSATPIDVSCTLVAGLSKVGTSRFLPKTVAIPVHGTDDFRWSADDNSGVSFEDETLNLSCQLPGGTALSMIVVSFVVDIGA